MLSPSLIITLALCTNAAVIVGTVALWLNYRARARMANAAPALYAEIKQLRETVEALASEVDRLTEAQRTTSRLLQESSSMRPTFPASTTRSVLPH